MSNRCHEPGEMGFLAELRAGDPRLSHVENCPGCRAMLTAYRSFERGCPTAGDAERERALGDFLDREIGVSAAVADRTQSRGSFRLLRFRFLSPGFAVAAVLVLFLSLQQYRSTLMPDRPTITRGGEAAAFHPAATPDDVGGVHLQWDAQADAETYVVVVYAADLRELARFNAASDVSLTLSVDQLAEMRPYPQPLLWRVEALKAGDLLVMSDPGVVPADGSP